MGSTDAGGTTPPQRLNEPFGTPDATTLKPDKSQKLYVRIGAQHLWRLLQPVPTVTARADRRRDELDPHRSRAGIGEVRLELTSPAVVGIAGEDYRVLYVRPLQVIEQRLARCHIPVPLVRVVARRSQLGAQVPLHESDLLCQNVPARPGRRESAE